MDANALEILLESPKKRLRPGEILRGGFRLNVPAPLPVKRVELSVVWYTEGKGEGDLGVAHLQTFAEDGEVSASAAFPFEVTLPDGPWSYHGNLIKVRWAVRVRVYPQAGSEIAGEERFEMRPAIAQNGPAQEEEDSAT